MKVLVSVFLVTFLVGCDKGSDVLSDSELESIDVLFASATATPEVMEKWARSCALCHVNGEGGAPKMADRPAWEPRLKQGKAMLYTHTIKGFNRMPPLGYCMDCSAQDYAAMINLLAGDSQ